MKFDFCIGNPPYQGDNHQQLYPDFYIAAKEIGRCVDLIFPIGWQEPKDGNNLKKINNPETKEDPQIVFIDNYKNVFNGIPGAEWVNIVIWKEGYNNGLEGKQLVLTGGENPQVKAILSDKTLTSKPEELKTLFNCVNGKAFKSVQQITSVRKPYGFSTDVIVAPQKYGLLPLQDSQKRPTDIKVYCKSNAVKYVPKDYPLPKISPAMNKYKVFVPYAWGNMSENAGLGGAYANIIIGLPNEICTETYQESGCFETFETAQKHAKFLMTKFARALLFLNKFSRHSTTAYNHIPVQSYEESWWDKTIDEIDEELMRKYNVPESVKQFVFLNIQKKTEANIVNFNIRKEME